MLKKNFNNEKSVHDSTSSLGPDPQKAISGNLGSRGNLDIMSLGFQSKQRVLESRDLNKMLPRAVCVQASEV